MVKPLTLDEAKRLRVGQALFHRFNKNADGTAQKWRVNAKVRVWERDPSKIKISVKSGTHLYDTITENELGMVSLEQPLIEKGVGIRPAQTIPQVSQGGCMPKPRLTTVKKANPAKKPIKKAGNK